VLEGTWREVERRGAAGARENGWRGRRGHGREQSRAEEGPEVDKGGLVCNFQKGRDSTVKLG
jgi:hypothetical protein